MYRYYSIEHKILNIANYDYKYFLSKVNVIGVGLGYKVKKGVCTFKKCIKVFVIKKHPLNKILPKDRISPFYKGIMTDVIETNVMKYCSYTERIRPVLCGYSIGSEKGALGGTLGCVVKDNRDFYVLSNSHVLAAEGRKIGDLIMQPSRGYGGRISTDTIAFLSKFIELKYATKIEEPENLVDCAIAKICNPNMVSPKLVLLGRIKGVADAKLGKMGRMIGCFSGLTRGEIIGLGVTMRVQYPKGTCLFKNQISTTLMAEQGDSGGILLDENLNGIGLLMSGSDTTNTFNDMRLVLNSLNVTIV